MTKKENDDDLSRHLEKEVFKEVCRIDFEMNVERSITNQTQYYD